MRRRLADPWTRAILAWTFVLVVTAVVLAAAAIVGFLRAADACYFQTGPCSEAGDSNWVLLQVTVFGIPPVWLVGLLVWVVARARSRRRSRDAS